MQEQKRKECGTGFPYQRGQPTQLWSGREREKSAGAPSSLTKISSARRVSDQPLQVAYKPPNHQEPGDANGWRGRERLPACSCSSCISGVSRMHFSSQQTVQKRTIDGAGLTSDTVMSYELGKSAQILSRKQYPDRLHCKVHRAKSILYAPKSVYITARSLALCLT